MIETCSLNGLLIITPKKIEDSRGFFSETYNYRLLEESGFKRNFVQDNQSLSESIGVVRGLHYQSPPFAQDKLVRVVSGAIFDVAVDIRNASPTYGKYFAVKLSSKNWKQLLIPAGFAHGFCTLEPNTEVVYKVSNYYSAEHDLGLRWNDPDINISWPEMDKSLLSEKDRQLPLLAKIVSPF